MNRQQAPDAAPVESMTDRPHNGHPMPRRSAKPTAVKKPPRPKPSHDRTQATPQQAEFGRFLRQCIDKAGLTLGEFAERLGGQHGGKLHPSMLSKIITGVVPPPAHAATGLRGANDGKGFKKATTWAKALGLTGKAADEFEFEVWLARTPLAVWDEFKRMEKSLGKRS